MMFSESIREGGARRADPVAGLRGASLVRGPLDRSNRSTRPECLSVRFRAPPAARRLRSNRGAHPERVVRPREADLAAGENASIFSLRSLSI